MHSFTPHYLANLRFDTRQLATLRALGEYRSKQRLTVAQSPEALADLKQVAVIESTESSNRLEGVVVSKQRLKSLVLKNGVPKGRSEQAIAGYRNALSLIHEHAGEMPFSEHMILQLHGILKHSLPFSISEIAEACPGVSRDMVRVVLRAMKSEGLIVSTGKGRGAKWVCLNQTGTPA